MTIISTQPDNHNNTNIVDHLLAKYSSIYINNKSLNDDELRHEFNDVIRTKVHEQIKLIPEDEDAFYIELGYKIGITVLNILKLRKK